MFTALLKQYWREGAIISLLATAYLLYNALTISKLETSQYRSALDYQNASLLAQKDDYEAKLAVLPKEIEKITVIYKTRRVENEAWEGDKNATDCENTDRYLREFNY